MHTKHASFRLNRTLYTSYVGWSGGAIGQCGLQMMFVAPALWCDAAILGSIHKHQYHIKELCIDGPHLWLHSRLNFSMLDIRCSTVQNTSPGLIGCRKDGHLAIAPGVVARAHFKLICFLSVGMVMLCCTSERKCVPAAVPARFAGMPWQAFSWLQEELHVAHIAARSGTYQATEKGPHCQEPCTCQ